MPNGVIFAFGKRYLQQVQAKEDLKYICKSAIFNFQLSIFNLKIYDKINRSDILCQ